MADGDIEVSLVLKDGQFKSAMTSAEGQTKRFKSTAETTGAKAGDAMEGVTQKVIRLGLTFLSLQTAKKLFMDLVRHSEDLQYVQEKIGRNLGEFADGVIRYFGGWSREALQAKKNTDALADSSIKTADIARDINRMREGLILVETTLREKDQIEKALGRIEYVNNMNQEMASLAKTLKLSAQQMTVLDAVTSVLTKTFDENAQKVQAVDDKLVQMIDDVKKNAKGLEAVKAIDPNVLFGQIQSFERGGVIQDFSKDLRDMGVNVSTLGVALDEARIDETLKSLTDQLKLNAEQLGLTDTAIDSIISKIRQVRGEQEQQAKKDFEDYKRQALEARKETFQGFQDGFVEAQKDMMDLSRVGADTARQIQSSFSDFFFDAFKTRVLDLKKLLSSLADFALRAVTNLLSGQLVGSLGGALGFVGLPGREHGGPVTPGRSYVVGESGRPEIFTPNQGGTITPVSRASAGGRAGGDQHFHFHAMDAASFMSFARANKGAFSAIMRELLGSDMPLRDAVRTA